MNRLNGFAWVIARQIKKFEWDNCKVNLEIGSLASIIRQDLETGYLKENILFCFEQALHIGHSAAVDTQLGGLSVQSPEAYTVACYRGLLAKRKKYTAAEIRQKKSAQAFDPEELKNLHAELLKTFPV